LSEPETVVLHILIQEMSNYQESLVITCSYVYSRPHLIPQYRVVFYSSLRNYHYFLISQKVSFVLWKVWPTNKLFYSSCTTFMQLFYIFCRFFQVTLWILMKNKKNFKKQLNIATYNLFNFKDRRNELNLVFAWEVIHNHVLLILSTI